LDRSANLRICDLSLPSELQARDCLPELPTPSARVEDRAREANSQFAGPSPFMKSHSFILAAISLVLLAALTLYIISKANHFEKEQSVTYNQNTSLNNQYSSFTETLTVSADPIRSPKTTQVSSQYLASEKAPPDCSSCQSHQPNNSSQLLANSKVKKLLSRNPETLRHQALADGTEFIDLNRTFSHISVAHTNPDGTASIHCSTSAQELSNAATAATGTKQAAK